MTSDLRAAFSQRFAAEPDVLTFAPGRVNLIGEHLDYNLGPVLPFAIPQGIHLAARRRGDGELRALSLELPAEPLAAPLREALAHPPAGWSRALIGVLAELAEEEPLPPGFGLDLALRSELPIGGGLSSSAALTVGLTLTARALLDRPSLPPLALARFAQGVENRRLGVACGLMDPLAIAAGAAGQALLIDCATGAFETVPLAPPATLVVIESGLPRRLEGSAFNARRAECEAAFAALQRARPSLPRLGLARPDEVEALPAPLRARARHVVTEEERVRAAVEALKSGDAARLGALMTASHRSLAEDFEVSSPGLDAIVATGLERPGCLGLRLTGAGFGGSLIALVEDPARFVEGWEAIEPRPRLEPVEAAAGARVLSRR